MRSVVCGPIALLLLVTGFATGAEPGSDAQSGVSDQRYHPEHVVVLKRMDRDGDGVLEPKEIPKAAEAYVAELAKDHGVNHKKGFKLDAFAVAFAKKEAGERAAGQRRHWHAEHQKVVSRMDRNRDGVLKPGEIPPGAEAFVAQVAKGAGINHEKPIPLAKLHQAHWKGFGELPHNHHDGSAFDPGEKLTPERAHLHAVSLIHLYDDGGNGTLEKAELDDLHKGWAEADGNKDGRLTPKEVGKALMSMSGGR